MWKPPSTHTRAAGHVVGLILDSSVLIAIGTVNVRHFEMIPGLEVKKL
jgi:hypothetical protein